MALRTFVNDVVVVKSRFVAGLDIRMTKLDRLAYSMWFYKLLVLDMRFKLFPATFRMLNS